MLVKLIHQLLSKLYTELSCVSVLMFIGSIRGMTRARKIDGHQRLRLASRLVFESEALPRDFTPL